MSSITNIIAAISVSVVTNITEIATDFRSMQALPCPDGIPGCAVFHGRGIDPQGKYVTETCVEVTTLSFDWCGKREVKTEKTLWITTRHLVLKNEWVEKKDEARMVFPGVCTNAFPPMTNALSNWLSGTNWIK